MFRRTCFEALRHQTPTLIGCNLLTITEARRPGSSPNHLLLKSAAISRASYYDTTFGVLSKLSRSLKNFDQPSLPQHALHRKANPFSTVGQRRGPAHNSLTMTYFHTGICTIIGAKSFHCPVRDGKEWDQLAMVVRHNGLPRSRGLHSEFIESKLFLIAFSLIRCCRVDTT